MLTLFYFLVCTIVWFGIGSGSWYLTRLLVGRATAPVNVKEMTFAWTGCFIFGLVPAAWTFLSVNGDPYLLYYVLLGGTYFGAWAGELCWLCFGD